MQVSLIKTTISVHKALSQRYRLLCVLLLSVFSAGCTLLGSGHGPFDPSLTNVDVGQVQADPSIPIMEEDDSLAIDSLDDNNMERKVRWGGTIVNVQNLEGPVTVFEVVSRPLERTGKPLHNDESSGRFLARVEQFIDPEIIKVGRDITFTGTLVGRYDGKVGDSQYLFPVLIASNYTFWTDSVVEPVQHFPDWDRFRHRRSLRR